MTDAAPQPLQLLGDAMPGASCVDDSCELQARHDQAVVNRLVDSGEV